MTRALSLLLLAACSRDTAPPAPVEADAAQRRVREVPSPTIRAFPPHAIRSDGVGPYLLEEPLHDVLRKLPEGPNLEVLQIGRYASWLVAAAEGGQILVGADVKGPVRFVAVVAPDVARTSAGVGVGATGADLLAKLGKPRPPRGVRDRVVYEMESLPGVEFITDAPDGTPPEKARVQAVLVARRDDPRIERACAGVSLPEDDVLPVARPKAEDAIVRYGCFTAPTPEALVVSGGEVVIVGGMTGEPSRLRRVTSVPLSPEGSAWPLDIDNDGRDEIVVIEKRRNERELVVTVRVLRWEAGHFVEPIAGRPFVIGEGTALAAGVTPQQLDIAVEVWPAPGGVAVGGLYLAVGTKGVRQLAPLVPIVLRAEIKGKGAAVAPDAGEPR